MQGPVRAERFPRWLLVLGGVVLVGLGVYYLRAVLTPIFFAFMIAYVLDPVVDRLEARRIPRALGIVIVLAVVLLALTLFFLLLVPGVIHEIEVFSRDVPRKVQALVDRVTPWLLTYGIETPQNLDDLMALVQGGGGEDGASELPVSASTLAERVPAVLTAVGGFLLGGTSSILSVVGSLVIVPVLAFYLLHDFDHMTTGIRDLIPGRYRPFVVDVATEIDLVLGQFIRGQLLVMLVLAILYSVAYSIVGIHLAIPIGIIAGLLAFIPYVGGASALILALLMCALNPAGWGQVIGVVVAYGVIQLLEGFVITPRIVGDKVGLPAVWVLVALMVGGELFGFLGVLLAVPAAAVGKIFVVRGLAYYRKSRIYLDAPEPPPGPLAGILEEEGLPDDEPVRERKEAAHLHDVAAEIAQDNLPQDDVSVASSAKDEVSSANAQGLPPLLVALVTPAPSEHKGTPEDHAPLTDEARAAAREVLTGATSADLIEGARRAREDPIEAATEPPPLDPIDADARPEGGAIEREGKPPAAASEATDAAEVAISIARDPTSDAAEPKPGSGAGAKPAKSKAGTPKVAKKKSPSRPDKKT